MHKTARYATLAGLLLAAGSVHAEGPHSYSWTAAVTTDYVFRGVSQTSEDAAFQASFDYGHESGFYAGIWGSGVDFGGTDSPNAEIDTYIGYSFPIGDAFEGDVQIVRYNYVGGDESAFEYNELIGKLTWNETITGTIGYSNDVFNSGEAGIYYGIGASHGWDSGTTVFGGVGYYDLNDVYVSPDGYVDWNLGVSQGFGPVELSLTYFDTDEDGNELFGDIAGNRVVAAAKVSF
jgi:uncharacterized protein (TIGR02001 family)